MDFSKLLFNILYGGKIDKGLVRAVEVILSKPKCYMSNLIIILAIRVSTPLRIRQVTEGKCNWKRPLFINMSPGSFPENGSWCPKVKSKPNTTRKTPARINMRLFWIPKLIHRNMTSLQDLGDAHYQHYFGK